MKTWVPEIAVRWLVPLLVALSWVVLYRGHNEPGGGFIGGLLAASAYVYSALVEGTAAARRRLRVDPVMLVGLGLAVAAGSGLLAWWHGQPFLTGLWLPDLALPWLGKVHLGTPLLFDVGVYLTVVGFALTTLFHLAEEH